MRSADRNALVVSPVVVVVGAAIAVAGSQKGASVHGVPVFALSVALAFVVQWLAFVPAYLLQTERFFDLAGSVTYIAVTTIAVVLGPAVDGRSALLLTLVVVWAGRLGAYLFSRVRKAGSDVRFDEIKPSFVRFLNAWTLQGLWVSLTLAATLAAITTKARADLDVLAVIGFLVWASGFALEAMADLQKSRFRADPRNRGRFIDTGLWSWSRHPNYFGEIALWVGVAIIALPVLHGWQWVTLVSPLFVVLLLTRVSGVPLLEKSADARWAGPCPRRTHNGSVGTKQKGNDRGRQTAHVGLGSVSVAVQQLSRQAARPPPGGLRATAARRPTHQARSTPDGRIARSPPS